MELNIIGEFIANYGFPCVACGIMFWLNHSMQKNHREETTALVTQIHHNTVVLEKILTKIGEEMEVEEK